MARKGFSESWDLDESLPVVPPIKSRTFYNQQKYNKPSFRHQRSTDDSGTQQLDASSLDTRPMHRQGPTKTETYNKSLSDTTTTYGKNDGSDMWELDDAVPVFSQQNQQQQNESTSVVMEKQHLKNRTEDTFESAKMLGSTDTSKHMGDKWNAATSVWSDSTPIRGCRSSNCAPVSAVDEALTKLEKLQLVRSYVAPPPVSEAEDLGICKDSWTEYQTITERDKQLQIVRNYTAPPPVIDEPPVLDTAKPKVQHEDNIVSSFTDECSKKVDENNNAKQEVSGSTTADSWAANLPVCPGHQEHQPLNSTYSLKILHKKDSKNSPDNDDKSRPLRYPNSCPSALGRTKCADHSPSQATPRRASEGTLILSCPERRGKSFRRPRQNSETQMPECKRRLVEDWDSTDSAIASQNDPEKRQKVSIRATKQKTLADQKIVAPPPGFLTGCSKETRFSQSDLSLSTDPPSNEKESRHEMLNQGERTTETERSHTLASFIDPSEVFAENFPPSLNWKARDRKLQTLSNKCRSYSEPVQDTNKSQAKGIFPQSLCDRIRQVTNGQPPLKPDTKSSAPIRARTETGDVFESEDEETEQNNQAQDSRPLACGSSFENGIHKKKILTKEQTSCIHSSLTELAGLTFASNPGAANWGSQMDSTRAEPYLFNMSKVTRGLSAAASELRQIQEARGSEEITDQPGYRANQRNDRLSLPYWPQQDYPETASYPCNLCGDPGHQYPDFSCAAAMKIPHQNLRIIKGKEDVLSNFYPCDLYAYGYWFCCLENAYQFKKALFCGDKDTAGKFITAKDASEGKALSHTLGKLPAKWYTTKSRIMRELLRLKMEHVPEFRRELLASDGLILAHTLGDDYWGTGLDTEKTLHVKQEYWPGKNMQGVILTELRDRLLQGQLSSQREEDQSFVANPHHLTISEQRLAAIGSASHSDTSGCMLM